MSCTIEQSAPRRPRRPAGDKPYQAASESSPRRNNRRRGHRFALCLPGQCRRVEQPIGFSAAAPCRCVNISSTGVLFRASEAFEPGELVEVFIEWPCRLDDGASLSLVVEGPIVWKKGLSTAMRIERYQFRTRAVGGPPRPLRALPTGSLVVPQ